MKKIIFIILLVVAVVYLGLSFIVPKINQGDVNKVPSVQDAPYLVQTVSRVYYAKQVTGTAPNITMKGYYFTNHNRWEYVSKNFTFDKNFKATVTRR